MFIKHKIVAIWFFLLVFTVPVLAVTEEEITSNAMKYEKRLMTNIQWQRCRNKYIAAAIGYLLYAKRKVHIL